MRRQWGTIARCAPLVACAVWRSYASPDSSAFRGLWVDAFGPGFFSVEQVQKLATDCRNYNFNAVIVEMRRRGDAFYFPGPKNPEPRTTIIPTNFDALAEIIKACHTGTPRIEVHCWVTSHFIWSADEPPEQPNHVFNRHPEYLTMDSIGQKRIGKGWFLDAGNPEANEWIYDVVKDVVSRYDIDGLHWDYLRYPARDSGYNETAIKRFNEELGRTGRPRPDDPQFCEWRRRQVTDFLRWANAEMFEIKPTLVLSAAVFANYDDSYGYRFADWAEWNREGILDICMPMNFSPDNQRVFFPRLEMALANQGKCLVYIGQAGYLNAKENTLAQLKSIRQKSFPGTVFYSYRNPNSGKIEQATTFAYLREEFQPTWTDTPALQWKKTKGIIKGTVTQNGKAIYNALGTITTDPPRTQKTEPHGKFAFFGLSPGHYTITATAMGWKSTRLEVQLSAAQTIHRDLLLGP